MRKVNFRLISALLLTSSITIYSCVDNDYDLTKDIDLTISVGGSEFAIPGGMTEEIKLSKVLKLEDEDLVKTDENGNYFLLKKAERTTANEFPITSQIKVDGFTVQAPDIDPINMRVSFGNSWSKGTRAGGNERFSVDVEPASSEFEIYQDGIPEELKKLSTITTDMTARIKFSFNQQNINRLYLENIKIKFPEYIISNELTADHCLIIQNQVVSKGSVGFSRNVRIQGIDCNVLPSGEGLNSDNHSISISGEVTISGSVYVNQGDVIGSPIFPMSFSLMADVDLGAIIPKEIKGVVKPNISIEPSAIKLDGMPDFLSDDEVRLDVKNPMVYLTTQNGSPVEATLNGKLTSYKTDLDGSIAGPVNFTIPAIGSGEQQFCISAMKTEIQNTTNIIVPDLGTLVERIPDEIRFSIDAGATDKEVTVELNKEYTLAADYEVNVPFVFGEKLSIVYKDTIDGWMEDIKDYEVQLVQATATAYNKIPLALIFTAEAITLDAKGEPVVLDGVDIKVRTNGSETDNTIKTGDSSEAGVATPIVIEIRETKAGSIKQLDGLFLRATAKSSAEADGKQLNENQSLQLKNVRLKVPGGLKVDLN